MFTWTGGEPTHIGGVEGAELCFPGLETEKELELELGLVVAFPSELDFFVEFIPLEPSFLSLLSSFVPICFSGCRNNCFKFCATLSASLSSILDLLESCLLDEFCRCFLRDPEFPKLGFSPFGKTCG